VTSGPAAPSRRGALVDFILSLGVMGLGIAAAVVALSLPAAGGYSRVGPNVMPVVVSFGLILFGGLLLAECFTGGWRARTPDDPAERGEHGFVVSAFGWVSAGLFAQMALINTAGFVLAAAVLFACVARGFGSGRWLRDSAIGLLLGLGVFLFFVRFLNVNLPAGWLRPILGGAGL
jgi:putative tricarboxylic transport membrane protein